MQRERIAVVEATLDDMNPEIYDYVIDRLFAQGALEVFLQPVIMKKSRPGTTLTVLCAPQHVEALATVIFAETTTLGLRWREEQRLVAERRLVEVHTPAGTVRVKLAEHDGRLLNAAPEYEDCKQLAQATGRPLKEVFDLARLEAQRQFGGQAG